MGTVIVGHDKGPGPESVRSGCRMVRPIIGSPYDSVLTTIFPVETVCRGVAAFYLKPLLAAFGSSIRAWWARGGTSDPRRRIEGEGVSWLRNWVSSVTKPNVQTVAAK